MSFVALLLVVLLWLLVFLGTVPFLYGARREAWKAIAAVSLPFEPEGGPSIGEATRSSSEVGEVIDISERSALKSLSRALILIRVNFVLMSVPLISGIVISVSMIGELFAEGVAVGIAAVVFGLTGILGSGLLIGAYSFTSDDLLSEASATVKRLERLRTGDASTLQLETQPVRLGEELRAQVDTGIPAGEDGKSPSFTVALVRYHQVVYPKQQARLAEFRKETVVQGHVPAGKETVHVPVAFDLPFDQPPSPDERPSPQALLESSEDVEFPLWQVQITAEDDSESSYHARFPLSVREAVREPPSQEESSDQEKKRDADTTLPHDDRPGQENEPLSWEVGDESLQDTAKEDESISGRYARNEADADAEAEIAASEQAERLAGGGLRMRLRPGSESFLRPLLVGLFMGGISIFVLWTVVTGDPDLMGILLALVGGIPSAVLGIILFSQGIKLFFTFLLSVDTILTIEDGTLEVRSGRQTETRIPCNHLLDVDCELKHAGGQNFEQTTFEMTLYGFDPNAEAVPPEGIDEDMLQTLRASGLQNSRQAPHPRVEPYVTALCTLTGIGDGNAARWILQTADRQARSR